MDRNLALETVSVAEASALASARFMGMDDMGKVYNIEELAAGEVMFAATGVTDGDFLKGVRFF